jgi:hypothetical protein
MKKPKFFRNLDRTPLFSPSRVKCFVLLIVYSVILICVCNCGTDGVGELIFFVFRKMIRMIPVSQSVFEKGRPGDCDPIPVLLMPSSADDVSIHKDKEEVRLV